MICRCFHQNIGLYKYICKLNILWLSKIVIRILAIVNAVKLKRFLINLF